MALNGFGHHGIPKEQKLFFIQHLSLMLRAGLPLSRILEVLVQQAKGTYWKGVLSTVREDIEKGNTLAQSLAKHPKVFDEPFRQIVEVGELKGDLNSILDHYYTLLSNRNKIKSKIRGAMIYPAIVVIALIVLGIFSVVFVFPSIVELIEQVEGELPWITKAVISFSSLLIHYGIYLLILFVLLCVFLVWVGRTKKGRFFYHSLLVGFPIVGKITKQYNLAVITRNLGSLLDSGIPVEQSLDGVRQSLTNRVYQASLVRAKAMVKQGSFIHTALEEYKRLYPEMIQQIVVVGEESGRLAEMLNDVADFYEEKITQTMQTLSSIIEPVIILVLGVGVVIMALSVLLPLYSLSSFI